MMKKEKNVLTRVALRFRAVYLDVDRTEIDMTSEATVPVTAFIARLAENGFCVSEELLHALNLVSANRLSEITTCINDVMGVKLNWAPLVKGWSTPTGETLADHLITLFANILGPEAGFKGTTLPCGHLIPDGTFPLERYNGCPFCGTPFETAQYVFKGQASKLKELRLFTEEDTRHLLHTLLESKTPLDATQQECIGQLLEKFGLPKGVEISMKETAIKVIQFLVEKGSDEQAASLIKTPTDILRYLWYEKTEHLQIIEPKTLISQAMRLNTHRWAPADKSQEAGEKKRSELHLKYDRRECLRVATWMNGLSLTAEQAAEDMNPKRGMWVRMIHALRLGEYSRKKGFVHLARILDVFYRQDYTTWQGRLDKAWRGGHQDIVLDMLKKRPGTFARSLFSTMLHYGDEKTLKAFGEISDKIPSRLLLSLTNAAELYFDPEQMRLARPITGVTHLLEPHPLLKLYSPEDHKRMINSVNRVFTDMMERRFAAIPTDSKTMYIEPSLYQIPVSVGDRSTTIQDTSCALMGTRFAVEGDSVRLFLQWGKGLPAQHLDMDLSCRITFPDNKVEECAYYNLTCTGAKHSGDIRSIPEKVGTAEYIELSLPELEKAGARHVMFTCNAYSTGALNPNLVIGWMNSAYPMKLSEKDGVAYDPSCVQHMVRISEGNLSKGLVFGILLVESREIVWLEMPFNGQTLQNANTSSIESLLKRLENKLSIGELLEIKAMAQGLDLVDDPAKADEKYTYQWALNPAEVSLLLG